MNIIRKSIFVILALVLAACGPGQAPTSTPPLFIMEQPIHTDQNFISFNVDEIQILGRPGDPVGMGEFRLLLIGSDTEGRSSGTFCPGNESIKIATGDTVPAPCLFGISFDESKVGDGVFLMVIAVDEDESSLGGDLTYELISNRLSEALGKAVAEKLVTAGMSSTPITIAVSVLASFLGSKVKNWVEQADIIGVQGILLTAGDNWSAGKQTTVTSSDGGLRITYSVAHSTTIVKVTPTAVVVGATEVPARQPTTLTETFYDLPEDGEVLNRFCTDDWEICRGAAEANANWQDINVASIGGGFFPDGYLVERTFLFFDTSSIPSSATIDEATLHVYAGQYLNGNTTIHVARSNASPPLSTRSFQEFSNESGGSVTLTTPFDWGSMELQSNALRWITPGDVTKLVLLHDNDLKNERPSEQNDVVIATGEDSANRPYLEITYTVP